MIQVSHLTKIYKISDLETVAIDDVSFKINKGEFIAIMGPSGSGKSTLMHILGALDIPTSGSYILDGQDIGKMTDDELAKIRNQKIGFVFQSYNLLPRSTALRNVMLPMVYAGSSPEKRVATAKQLLEKVGLGDRMYHNSNQLSGGQQQRVTIARALTMNPAIILADEPTGNLATDQSKQIMEIFRDLNKQGHTIIMITHEPSVAKYARRVILLLDGKIKKETKNGAR